MKFENVHVDRMTTTSMIHLAACVFQCVKLSGSVGSVMTTPPSHSISAEARSLFAESIKEQYRDIEWALDISEAEFVSADFYYVPGDLVRRDEETQFLLHREKLANVEVGKLGQYAQIAVSRFDSSPFDSIVAVAPKKANDFPEILADLQELRRLEVAE
ncbi:hypothetical protein ACL02U_32610 [Streptomyces sp. MS06]|uniref:hypothetical protein n=1 Tax=Streptomyces sp. MS06 TaxID=3385974 RepID=UPI0039A3C207